MPPKATRQQHNVKRERLYSLVTDRLTAMPPTSPRVYIYPSDVTGCGYFRLIWPGRELERQGYPVTVRLPSERSFNLDIDKRHDRPVGVRLPADAEVVVMQRLSHRYMAQAVELMRRRGVAVVVDMDDDLSRVSSRNAAHNLYHPPAALGITWDHSADNCAKACAAATRVTVSTPALKDRYGTPGRATVIPNYLPDLYYNLPRIDHPGIMWPASIDTHPDDPAVLGDALRRVLLERPWIRFGTIAVDRNIGAARIAFGLTILPDMIPPADVHHWPATVAAAGIGIAPLSPGVFSAAKSWLKPLELMACGVPWIASPSAPYKDLHRRTGVGLIAHTPAQWYEHLARLVDNPGLRADQSAAGVEAAARFRLADHVDRWWAVCVDAANAQQGSRRVPAATIRRR